MPAEKDVMIRNRQKLPDGNSSGRAYTKHLIARLENHIGSYGDFVCIFPYNLQYFCAHTFIQQFLVSINYQRIWIQRGYDV